LGHNGAGKSTTINILTGILKPDKGKINIFGLDYETEMAQIRQKIGVCLQIDVLYDRITVKEHLEFYGKLKGFNGPRLEQKVSETIKKSCLETEIDKRAETLSGGNKRKLCLACAAIGDSELIFLDEPSSGMDPKTRRMIWGMIEDLRG
jgi:ATP-binding cassette subfamily A (ABC1) protein 3